MSQEQRGIIQTGSASDLSSYTHSTCDSLIGFPLWASTCWPQILPNTSSQLPYLPAFFPTANTHINRSCPADCRVLSIPSRREARHDTGTHSHGALVKDKLSSHSQGPEFLSVQCSLPNTHPLHHTILAAIRKHARLWVSLDLEEHICMVPWLWHSAGRELRYQPCPNTLPSTCMK